MDPILLNKQLRENSKDIEEFCKDLKKWGDDMDKRNQKEKKKSETLIDEESKIEKPNKKTPSNKQITEKSYKPLDYSKWDKFDMQAQCEKVDGDSDSDENDESRREELQENANEIKQFFKELKTIEGETPKKDEKITKPEFLKDLKNKKPNKTSAPNKKITVKNHKPMDYSKWDKFDVEAECEKIDGDIDSDSSLTDENDESYREEALLEKDKGNKFVKEQKWTDAIKCYTNAIDFYSYDPVFYANRALCFLRKGDMVKCENDCNMSLKLDNTYVKAYQRRAAALEAQNKLYEAKQDLLKVLQLEPHNKETKGLLDILKTKMGEYVESPDIKAQRPVSKFTASRNTGSSPLIVGYDLKSEVKSPDLEKTSSQSNWPQDDNIILVKPINKPPHLRSKKPLKRVEIQAIDGIKVYPVPLSRINQAIKSHVIEKHETTTEHIKEDRPKSLFKSKKLKISDNIDPSMTEDTIALPRPNENFKCIKSDDFKIVEKKSTDNTQITKEVKNNSNIIITEQSSKKFDQVDFSVPKTSVQFCLAWSNMKSNEEKYKYLKIIDPQTIPKIFQQSLESHIFSSILEILVKNFIENKDCVYSVLEYLTEVRRFSMLTMFMTTTDKNYLWKLFDYVQSNEQKTKEEVEILIKKYEM